MTAVFTTVDTAAVFDLLEDVDVEGVATDAVACECGDQACYFCAVEYDAWLDEQIKRCEEGTQECVFCQGLD